MCGRYTLRRINLIRAAVDAVPTLPFEEFTERPRFNVAPRQEMPIVRMGKEAREISIAQWGLIPRWTKGKPKLAPINCKCETAATSAMFRDAFARRRCLVPADGFYEWKGAAPPKQPFFIHRRDDSILAFAGLWERWRENETAEPIDTFTILTTSPNDLMKGIHNRMPVILKKEDYARWLDAKTPAEELNKLIVPDQTGELEAYEVSTHVNNVRNDDGESLK